MRIIQITDLHVSGAKQEVKGDADTRANLFLILQHVISLKYDLLTITGDFCYTKPHKEIYAWIYDQLSGTLDMSKIRVISGNHDDTKMMAAAFDLKDDLKGDEFYYKEELNGQTLFFLDTAKDESSSTQKAWLVSELHKLKSKRVVIFMHHPPIISDVQYMDQNYPLKDMNDFQDIFNQFPEKKFDVFCGHYHCDRVVTHQNLTVYITPSCYVQLDPDASKFEPDHYDIGYRNIDLLPEGKLITEVKYLL